jgi:hypothetical protein
MGASTRPWLVTVDTGSELKEFVIKLFSKKDEKQYQPTNKEFYSSVLAEEFDLSVPPYALIYLNEEFIDSLEFNDRERIEQIGKRYFFGCEYIHPALNYSNALTKKHLDSYDIENIFAFDVLIRNMDRKEKKPNIFFRGKEYFLIDHEQSLDIRDSFAEYIDDADKWPFIRGGRKGKHIFIKFLQKDKRKVDFNTFMTYMNVLNLTRLDNCVETLKEKGIETSDYKAIKPYLEEVRFNRAKFLNLLLELIQ